MIHRILFLQAFLSILFATAVAAEPLTPVALPKPQTDGGRPLVLILAQTVGYLKR